MTVAFTPRVTGQPVEAAPEEPRQCREDPAMNGQHDRGRRHVGDPRAGEPHQGYGVGACGDEKAIDGKTTDDDCRQRKPRGPRSPDGQAELLAMAQTTTKLASPNSSTPVPKRIASMPAETASIIAGARQGARAALPTSHGVSAMTTTYTPKNQRSWVDSAASGASSFGCREVAGRDHHHDPDAQVRDQRANEPSESIVEPGRPPDAPRPGTLPGDRVGARPSKEEQGHHLEDPGDQLGGGECAQEVLDTGGAGPPDHYGHQEMP